MLVVLDIWHLASNEVFGAREKRVQVKGVDIEEIQQKEKET